MQGRSVPIIESSYPNGYAPTEFKKERIPEILGNGRLPANKLVERQK
jgi:hypothetical protein